jgi:uncharacterized SAM-binding protein YcdF (DUF218 family)
VSHPAPPAGRARTGGRDGARRALDGALLLAAAFAGAGALGVLRLVGLSELGDAWVALLAGAVLRWWRPAIPRAAAAACAVVLAVVLCTPVAGALLESRVRRDLPPAAAAADLPADVDAVVVLSASVLTDGLLADRSVYRLLAGVEWARRLERPLALGVVRQRRPGAVSSEADQRRLAALGGVSAVHFVAPVWVTRDEAVGHAALARRMGWRRVLVVTSPSHSRRTCAAFERAGLRVTCAPAPAREYALGGPRPLGSAAERLRAFADWLYELAGWWSYRYRGWV